MTEESFAARLALAMGDEKPLPFSRRIGKPNSTVQNWLKRSEPGPEDLVVLADALGVSIEWLAVGRGPIRPAPTQSQNIILAGGELPEGAVLVERLAVEASAGGGVLAPHEDTVDYMALPELWLRSLGVLPSSARVMTVRGDSNEPTLRDRDTLIVDISIRSVLDERFYIVIVGGVVVVKRVVLVANGGILLKSDNLAYPPLPVPAADLPDLHIAGRVAWYGRGI